MSPPFHKKRGLSYLFLQTVGSCDSDQRQRRCIALDVVPCFVGQPTKFFSSKFLEFRYPRDSPWTHSSWKPHPSSSMNETLIGILGKFSLFMIPMSWEEGPKSNAQRSCPSHRSGWSLQSETCWRDLSMSVVQMRLLYLYPRGLNFACRPSLQWSLQFYLWTP